ncbi:MAG: hypothetical protein H6607_11285 [Flavobacteriales bacterium]|nr:hypothetical protein [Flavobacteriales bacterium]
MIYKLFLAVDSWQMFVQFVQILLPSVIVFWVSYFTMKKMLDEDFKRKELSVKSKLNNAILPTKLQAYERLTILLERIKMDNLVMRTVSPSLSATEFKHVLIQTVNDEFNHNVSQQIYVSDQAWNMIKAAKENTLNIINNSYNELSEFAKATDLGKAILEEVSAQKADYTLLSIAFLKKEIDLVF